MKKSEIEEVLKAREEELKACGERLWHLATLARDMSLHLRRLELFHHQAKTRVLMSTEKATIEEWRGAIKLLDEIDQLLEKEKL